MSIYYITSAKCKTAKEVTSKQQYLAIRNSDEQLRNLQSAREGNAESKLRLAQFNYSGYYPKSVVKGNKLVSRAFGFDIDDREAFEQAKAKLLADPEHYGLLMLERSVNQGGHAIFQREMGKTILENQVRIAQLLDCEMDTSTHDINRVYFTTSASDDDLLFLSDKLFDDSYRSDDADFVAEVQREADHLDERVRLRLEDVPEQAHRKNKHFRPYVSNATAPAVIATTDEPLTNLAAEPLPETYMGIRYSEIIDKYWQLNNDGHTPVQSNRDTLTFELASQLRHICGHNRDLLDRIIPCYDGFPQTEKMKCIDSALSGHRTQMSARLREVLEAVRADHSHDRDIIEAYTDICEADNNYFHSQLGRMPQGIKESIAAVGSQMAFPAIVAVCPAIGMLASKVQLEVHKDLKHLNLISYIAGDYASGKGAIDPVIEAWLGEIQELDDFYLKKEDDFRNRKRAAKNKKEQPEEIKYPIRYLTLNNTVANLAERLANTEGLHAFSFTTEADTVAQKWRSQMSDFSVMLRQSYDNSSFNREARSIDAVNVHIKKLLWNVVMCGTPDALHRVVPNCTDGFQSRIAIARTPNNTFARLTDDVPHMTADLSERIRQVAHLLPLMSGNLVLDKLEQASRDWLEAIRIYTMMDNDEVAARQRMRTAVTAQRMTACLILCQVAENLIDQHGLSGAERELRSDSVDLQQLAKKAQTQTMLDTFRLIADSLFDNALYYFKDDLENAFNSRTYQSNSFARCRKSKNDTIFHQLPTEFDTELCLRLARRLKGDRVTHNAIYKMVSNWKNSGWIDSLSPGYYRKKAV